MKIETLSGNKTERDKKILITTNKEALTILDLTILVNRFALNELEIIDDSNGKFSRQRHFQFKKMMEKGIEEAEKGIDWTKCTKEYILSLKLDESPYCVPQRTLIAFMEGKNNVNYR